ncbi:MAG: FecR domain-containing protein [Gammaproteobacteria bacterium]
MRLRCFGYPALFAAACCVLTSGVRAQDLCQEPAGRFASIDGEADVQRGGVYWRAAELDQPLCEGDTVHVRDRSRVAIQLINNAVLRIDQNTSIRLVNISGDTDERSWLDLVSGALQSFSRQPWLLRVTTPHLKGDIDGTEFFVQADDDRSLLIVLEGRVLVSNDKGRLALASGQAATAEAGRAPVYHIVVRPRDAVQWALYYPPVLYLRPDEFPPGPGWQGMVRQSIESYLRGDRQQAFEGIATVPETVRDPRFFVYRASLLLAVGRVDEADADIERALRLAPHDGNALALQSIIATVENEKDKALDVAQRAVGAAPTSATALIALSYAQQARFDLEAARTSLETAVQLDPKNVLAWARLAELWSSFGRLDQSLKAAQKAVVLEPDLSRTQTVLGFAYLTEVKTTQAKAAFDKAITLDQANPLPRLGLGLAKIREGDLHEGRREIEVAASLDPNSSIVRSYLGKAYYEEKRMPLDEHQYSIAEELDPKDPSPWFYDAIAKQTTNRPVEALQDMQKAIELNDNRIVYRSRLSLDSDLAARSASLARVYTDLGFQPLALVEGWKSVNTDPTNYSAHRFLADSYSALPRHEIARVSELLQSQLLQPINTTPIQPHLAESNLFLISAQGPAALSFNEFNPIFNRNGFTLQTSGLVGENSTYAGEAVASGIYEKTSFSVGGFHFTTDGFRENAGQRDEIANAFVQRELSPQTSIQAEYRYRNVEHGDLQQLFFPEDFFPGLTDELESNTIRLGGRHAFSPDSILLGSFIYSDADALVRTDDFPEPGSLTEVKVPERAFSVELQHLFRSRYLSLQTGAGYFGVDRKDVVTFGFPGPDPMVIHGDLQHVNAYAYAYVNPLKNVTATLGLSFDSLGGDGDVDKDQVNPKFGITWTPFAGTALRAAAFRVLKRTLITDQTLEPTQVAGFNQFFDDFNLTEAWRYGGAIDQKFTKSLFGGLEFSKRDLTVPIEDVADPFNPVNRDVDWNEYLGRAYLLWTPHRWLAFRAQYIFERFERDVGVPRELDTHRVPLGIGFFHPSGLSASVTATYWNQEVTSTEFFDNTVLRFGSDEFWTVNAAISYRLPKRYGFISVGATNLLDEQFNFFEADLDNPTIQPTRTVFARVTLAFP